MMSSGSCKMINNWILKRKMHGLQDDSKGEECLDQTKEDSEERKEEGEDVDFVRDAFARDM